jgi:hypothetical protein
MSQSFLCLKYHSISRDIGLALYKKSIFKYYFIFELSLRSYPKNVQYCTLYV